MIDLSSVDQKRMTAKRELSPLQPNERVNLDVTNLKVGGYLNLRKENWKVIRIGSYLEVRWSDFSKRKKMEITYELTLFSLKTGSVHYLEYYVDDEVEVTFTDAEIKYKDITFNGKPLKFHTLMEISDEEEGTLYFNGKAFHYSEDETLAAQYFKDFENGNEPDFVRLYEFEAKDGTYLTVECWFAEQDEDKCEIKAYLSSDVDNSEIEILQVGGM